MANVWLGVLNRFVEKYLNVKGGPTVVDFNHQVQLEIPVLIGVEERYHQGWSRFCGAFGVTGGVGQSAGWQLHNPPTSNAIAVIERIGVKSTAAGAISFNLSFQGGPAGIADLPTTQTPPNLDGRSTTGSSMLYTTSTAAVAFAKSIGVLANVNQIESQFVQTENQEVTLIPGSALLVVDNTVADTGIVSIMWRERPLEPSELT